MDLVSNLNWANDHQLTLILIYFIFPCFLLLVGSIFFFLIKIDRYQDRIISKSNLFGINSCIKKNSKRHENTWLAKIKNSTGRTTTSKNSCFKKFSSFSNSIFKNKTHLFGVNSFFSRRKAESQLHKTTSAVINKYSHFFEGEFIVNGYINTRIGLAIVTTIEQIFLGYFYIYFNRDDRSVATIIMQVFYSIVFAKFCFFLISELYHAFNFYQAKLLMDPHINANIIKNSFEKSPAHFGAIKSNFLTQAKFTNEIKDLMNHGRNQKSHDFSDISSEWTDEFGYTKFGFRNNALSSNIANRRILKYANLVYNSNNSCSDSNSHNSNTNQNNKDINLKNENTTLSNHNINSNNHDVNLKNENTTLSNHNINSSNRNINSSNHNINYTSRNTTLSNHDVNLKNENTILSNYDVNLKNENTTLSNHNINSSNHNINYTNRNINPSKNSVSQIHLNSVNNSNLNNEINNKNNNNNSNNISTRMNKSTNNIGVYINKSTQNINAYMNKSAVNADIYLDKNKNNVRTIFHGSRNNIVNNSTIVNGSRNVSVNNTTVNMNDIRNMNTIMNGSRNNNEHTGRHLNSNNASTIMNGSGYINERTDRHLNSNFASTSGHNQSSMNNIPKNEPKNLPSENQPDLSMVKNTPNNLPNNNIPTSKIKLKRTYGIDRSQ